MADTSETAAPIATPPPASTIAAIGATTEVDEGFEENDSAYGDEQSAYTASLTSSIKNHTYEHGRRYASYQPEGSTIGYVGANDEQENDRMDMHHHLSTLILGNVLHTAPIGKTPQRILDLGTGTGIWAIEIGDEYPSAEVIGVDLSPTQPSMVPPNVKFEIDDVEQEWTFNEKFDFIHSRFMAGSITNWPKYVERTLAHVKPGGWVEFKDWEIVVRTPDNSLPPTNPIARYHDMLLNSCAAIGRTLVPGPSIKQWCIDAGFVNVKETVHPVPFGLWPKDKRYKEIGAWNLLCLLEGLEGISLRLFIDVLGLTEQEVYLLAAEVREAFKNKSIHAQYTYYNVTAQRPELEGDE